MLFVANLVVRKCVMVHFVEIEGKRVARATTARSATDWAVLGSSTTARHGRKHAR
jgi:hypothetical protein